LKLILEKLFTFLPDSWYFFIMGKCYLLKNPDRRGCKTKIRKLEPCLYLAEDPDGTNIFFSVRSRFARYLFPNGVKNLLDSIKKKYELGDGGVMQGDIVLDIGANIGEFSMAIASKAGHIYCIEPDPAVIKTLRKNMERFNNVTIIEVGLSDQSGNFDFYLSTIDADSSFFPPMTYSKKITIKAMRLDNLVSDYQILSLDFIKLEAEGWEPEVLLGAPLSLKACNQIVVDAGPERGGYATADDVSNILNKAGFTVTNKNFIVAGFKKLGN